MTESIFGNNIAEQLVFRLGIGRMWAGSDEGHVALEDIEQLRQLVDAEGSQPLAKPGNSWVTSRGLPITQKICHAVMHGAKFVTGKQAIIETETGLAE